MKLGWLFLPALVSGHNLLIDGVGLVWLT